MSTAKVVIGLSNPKSPANVGAVLRAVGCFAADAVFYTGERYDRAARFHTDTNNAAASVPVTRVDQLLQGAPAHASIVCIELAEGAIPLAEYQHPERAFYLFGPEDGSLSQALVDRADAVVYIPTRGCLNLAATVNIVLYDRQAKARATPAGNALIRESRDSNNRVKVRQPLLHD